MFSFDLAHFLKVADGRLHNPNDLEDRGRILWIEFGEEPTWGVVIFNKAEKQIIAKHVPQVQNMGG